MDAAMLPKVPVAVCLFHIILGSYGAYPDLLGVASSSAYKPFLHRDSHRVKPKRKHPPPIVNKVPRRPLPQYHHPSPAPPHQHPAAAGQQPLYHSSPPPQHAPIYEEPNPYSFGYKVKDHYEGIEHGHQEKSDGKTVIGTYNVDLPDGRRQTVDYQADHYTGYLANVQYEGEAQYPEPGYYNQPVTFKPYYNPEHHIPEYQSQDVAQDHLQPSYHLPSVHQETSGGYYKRSTPPPPPPLELQRYEYKQPQPSPQPQPPQPQPPPPPLPATYQQVSPAAHQHSPSPSSYEQPPPLPTQYGNEPAYEPPPQTYYQPPPPPPQTRQDAHELSPYTQADPELQYWEQQQQYLQQQGQYSQYQPEYAYPVAEPEPEPYIPEPYNYGW